MDHDGFTPVWHHRLKYFLSPQLDLYRNIASKFNYNSVFDYGCGTGFGTIQLGGLRGSGSDRSVVVPCAIDVDEHAIGFAREVLGHLAQFKSGDILMSPDVDSSQYTLVTCIEVIEHVIDPGLLIHRLADKVFPGYHMVISSINRDGAYRKNVSHTVEWNVEEFESLLQAVLPDGELTITDFTLDRRIDRGSQITPMVAIWRKV